MEQVPLINGESYSWSQIVLNILGTPIVGFTAISYKESQEKVNNYGAGNRPVSRGYGKKEYEGSITFHMEELQAIAASAPNRSILDIPPFDVVVSFLPKSGTIVTHTLRMVEFLEDPFDGSEGDTAFELEVPIILAGIDK
jgi:hypothetical protein